MKSHSVDPFESSTVSVNWNSIIWRRERSKTIFVKITAADNCDTKFIFFFFCGESSALRFLLKHQFFLFFLWQCKLLHHWHTRSPSPCPSARFRVTEFIGEFEITYCIWVRLYTIRYIFSSVANRSCEGPGTQTPYPPKKNEKIR